MIIQGTTINRGILFEGGENESKKKKRVQPLNRARTVILIKYLIHSYRQGSRSSFDLLDKSCPSGQSIDTRFSINSGFAFLKNMKLRLSPQQEQRHMLHW